jgi:hypothetical protein
MARVFALIFALALSLSITSLRAELSSADLNLVFGQYQFGLVHEFSKNDKNYILSDTLIIQGIGHETKKPLFSKTDYRWLVDKEYPKFGADITGDGQPDAVVFAWSGGAHCCYDNYIFELGNTFRAHQIYSGDFPLKFVDLEAGGALEIIVQDTNFLYWLTSFSRSPAPRVILYYKDGTYKIAMNLMRDSPPIQLKLDALKTSLVKGKAAWEIANVIAAPPDQRADHYLRSEEATKFLKAIIDLVYSGNMATARALIDRAWPSAAPGKDAFLREFFECQVRHSHYWSGIARLNGVPANPPAKGCPGGPESG